MLTLARPVRRSSRQCSFEQTILHAGKSDFLFQGAERMQLIRAERTYTGCVTSTFDKGRVDTQSKVY